jgi:hypothetical protein
MTSHRKTLIQKAAYTVAYAAGLTLLALPLRAETKLDTAEYWKAFAYRHAAGEQFEASLTEQQRNLRDAMNTAAEQVQTARSRNGLNLRFGPQPHNWQHEPQPHSRRHRPRPYGRDTGQWPAGRASPYHTQAVVPAVSIAAIPDSERRGWLVGPRSYY